MKIQLYVLGTKHWNGWRESLPDESREDFIARAEREFIEEVESKGNGGHIPQTLHVTITD